MKHFIFKERFSWFDTISITIVTTFFSYNMFVEGIISGIVLGTFSSKMTTNLEQK